MSLLVITRFSADPAHAEQVPTRHADLVSATRAAVGGPIEARLGRVDERQWVGVWRWESAEQLAAAREVAPGSPAATAAFALVDDHPTAEEIPLVDER
ncbi:antibiotic biosynthesis monooxygenase [Micromonospora chokoriensis]|uniref:Antibiotic biosynthesis monooxygenase n=1 Tax=Micromonospora chokoriensis TaxID=356851 RepID=A0A1C4WZF9_9ACTN|nr:antibiotic biosynthesis monooxygenase [Micromonospora chokoriensis]SCF01578.1 Antibiotic biosynthesis monooxygenase [Micromonospora chokoriensis]